MRAAMRLRAAKYGEPMEADHPMWDDFVESVLMTLREPSEGMTGAADDYIAEYGRGFVGANEVFTVMVDHLHKEKWMRFQTASAATANAYTIRNWPIDVLRRVAVGMYSRPDERERAVDELIRRLAEGEAKAATPVSADPG